MEESTTPLERIEEEWTASFACLFPDSINFTQESWNLSSLFLHEVAIRSSFTNKQTASIIGQVKSMRLVRSITGLAATGYWPEAEILSRALLEVKLQVLYIMKDKTSKRAEIWIGRENPRSHWPVKEMIRDTGEIYTGLYERLSAQSHNHTTSSRPYFLTNPAGAKYHLGPIPGKESYEASSEIIGSAGMTNAAINEIAAGQFEASSNWEDRHQKLMEMPYFQSKQPGVQKLLSEQNSHEKVSSLITALEEGRNGHE